MVKKKEQKLTDTNDLLFNIFTNIVNTETKINKSFNTNINIDFVHEFLNFDYIYSKFDFKYKKIYTHISKFINIDKYDLIANYNIKKNINTQFKYFTIKYENFAIKQCKEHTKFFFNMCYGVLMIMTKYMILIYSVNIFISIMKALFELSLKKAQ